MTDSDNSKARGIRVLTMIGWIGIVVSGTGMPWQWIAQSIQPGGWYILATGVFCLVAVAVLERSWIGSTRMFLNALLVSSAMDMLKFVMVVHGHETEILTDRLDIVFWVVLVTLVISSVGFAMLKWKYPPASGLNP